jgi:hypothetical protein
MIPKFQVAYSFPALAGLVSNGPKHNFKESKHGSNCLKVQALIFKEE